MPLRIPPRHLVTMLFALTVLLSTARSQERELKTSELTHQADVVVLGRVADVRSAWNRDRTRIQTAVTVTIDQSLKGTPGGGSVTILTPGGEVDGVGEYYSHTARFKKDEDVVVFARKAASGELRVTGGEQGKVAVRKDEVTGARMVAGDMTLDAFIARVKGQTTDVTK
ncbi:MAG: hypothetical protein IPI01_05695 [Ignavibacteriae bacterium]|nr:hypothetical protein [Ignavibacteriota bacterium]